jgi:DNA invertase Pin-like site-specific DNA recombinase
VTGGWVRKARCAVYTRKSTDEGLDQDFNSLDAQREACEAYILSQKGEGWLLVPDRYDDGGISGGTMERPALKRLLADIQAGKIDVIVVYKVDRLTRALMDFSKLVETFNAHGVTFVSITQQFNTTTSMGRLTLNMLLTFAQFEREVIGERIRDKIAASRRRGIWMGGSPPLGYDVGDRRLIINDAEAEIVRYIFDRFAQVRSMVQVMRDVNTKGYRTKTWTTIKGRERQGHPFDKVTIRKILTNRVYLGEAVHKGSSYPGEHKPIITQAAWEKAHAVFDEHPRQRAARSRAKTPALLKGLIFVKETGRAMVPTFTRKRGRLYRYYVSTDALKVAAEACPVRRVPAGAIEAVVLAQVRAVLRSPEVVAQTWLAVREEDESVPANAIREALAQFDALWDELFPLEQARIVGLLVERVDVDPESLEVRINLEGLKGLMDEIRGSEQRDMEAA